MNDTDNFSRIKIFGKGISEEGRLANRREEVEILQSIRSIESVLSEEVNGLPSDSKIIVHLKNGGTVLIRAWGTGYMEIEDVMGVRRFVENHKLRALFDKLTGG